MSSSHSASDFSTAPTSVSELPVQEVTETEFTHPPYGDLLEKTPGASHETPESDRLQGRKSSEAFFEARPPPAARVCLEKRFSITDDQEETPRAQGPVDPPAAFSSFLSILQEPTEMFEATLQSEPGICRMVPLAELPYQSQGNAVCSLSDTSLGCSVVDPAKHQDLLFPRNFSFTYHPKEQAVKAGFYALAKPAQESRVWVQLEGEGLEKPVLLAKQGRGGRYQPCPQYRVLSDIQNVAGSTVASGPNTRKDKVIADSLERRERHNNMERDRRRKIRKCCDELNTLVPFCNIETDKATTLQWTTVFLKYIRETRGDSLKLEFQDAFCSKKVQDVKVGDAADYKAIYREGASQPSSPTGDPN